MTIVVTIRVTDGLVLAGDSATTFSDAAGVVLKVYNNANKIFNLIKGRPIGAMTYGSGSIGKASIATLSKDLRSQMRQPTSELYIDPANYTVEEVAIAARKFFFEKCFKSEYPNGSPNFGMGYRVCGYSVPGESPEVWEFIVHDACVAPVRVYEDDHYGPRWAGETEAIDRLVLGLGTRFVDSMVELGAQEQDARNLQSQLIPKLCAQLYLPAMPIQDAIDLARFLAGTAARFSELSMKPPTVGGQIEIATITKHEGFKWVARKHYYSAEFNVTSTDHV